MDDPRQDPLRTRADLQRATQGALTFGAADAPDPNTNVCHPRTLLPSLSGQHGTGDHWLACAVAPSSGTLAHWETPPTVELAVEATRATVRFRDLALSFHLDAAAVEPPRER